VILSYDRREIITELIADLTDPCTDLTFTILFKSGQKR